jgi:hypothetical protein
MYCPNCGQQQVSNEMRFCSRCGLALTGLADWLAGGGRPVTTQTQEAPAPAQAQPLSPRRKGMRRAAKMMFFSGALFPIFLMIALAEDEGAAMIVPFFLFFISLAWMLYARLFSDPNPIAINKQSTQPSRLVSMPAHTPLPPASTIPISDMRGTQVRTNELAQPPSVTEQTTRFLDKE